MRCSSISAGKNPAEAETLGVELTGKEEKMEYKTDFESLTKYYEAFWNCEVLDRIAASVTAIREGYKNPSRKGWLTPGVVMSQPVEKVLDIFEEDILSVYHGGLAVPFFWPNLGPDAFSGFLGAEMHFPLESANTSWSDWKKNLLTDYEKTGELAISDENLLYKKNIELLRMAAERGKDRYLVGVTDLHAGFDSLAVLRGGPDKVAMDLVDNPEGVKKAMRSLFAAWKKVYDDYFSIVKETQRGTITWLDIWAPGKMCALQNDFSCLVSPRMYREFFLEGLLMETGYLDYSIYHLDGPEALQHLDILLEIPGLNAIQWVSGARASGEGIEKWFPLYKKIQEKKKAIILYPRPEEIDKVLENLKPEGLMLKTYSDSEKEAVDILKKLGW